MAKDPDLSIVVPHSLTDEVAKERIGKLFDAALKRYGPMTKEIALERIGDEPWRLKVSAYGLRVNGEILFSPGKVEVKVETLPLMIKMAKGKVIGMLKSELERFLL